MMESMEGFVCPMCKLECENPTQLMAHYEQAHGSGADEAGTIWGKAKAKAKRMMASRLNEDGPAEGADLEVPFVRVIFEDQTIGISRRHTTSFRASRKARRHRVDLEQNQLLHRLDKLLYKGPSTVGIGKGAVLKARREHEKTVVSWMDETLVPICPGCGNHFGFLRRRHHCRLCGSVLCADCSLGLEASLGVKVLQKQGSSTSLLGGLRGGEASFDRKLKIGEDEMLRVCTYCHETILDALSVKSQKQKVQEKPPAVALLHEKMLEEMDGALDKLPAYNSVAFALMKREQLDRFEDAQRMRNEISKRFDTIDVVSKKITLIKNKNKTEAPVDPKSSSQTMYRGIRKRAVEFLQQHRVTMMKLPEAKTILQWRRAELEADRAREAAAHKRHQEAMRAMRRRQEPELRERPRRQKEESSHTQSRINGDISEDTRKPPADTVDPAQLKQETKISLRKCLKQAQRAGKLDEVEALQRQLQELEMF